MTNKTREGILEAILDTCDDAVVTCDPGGRVATWNRSAELLFGQAADRAIGVPFVSFFPVRVRPEVAAMLGRAERGDRIRHYEAEVVRGDGMPLPLSMSLSPVRDRAHVLTAVVLIVRDLTEQKLAQATLAEMDARLQEGEALSHTGSWLIDLRTGVVQWKPEFYRIHDIDPLEFGGTVDSYLDALLPEDRDRMRDLIERAARSARPFEAEYRVSVAGDQVRMVRVRAEPAVGSDSTVVGLRGIGQEIA